MTAKEFSNFLKRFGLNATGAGRIFGVHPRAITRWASGESPIKGPVERLVWCIEHDKTLLNKLRDAFYQ